MITAFAVITVFAIVCYTAFAINRNDSEHRERMAQLEVDRAEAMKRES